MVSGSKDNQQPVKLWDPKAGQGISTLYDSHATVVLLIYCVCANHGMFFLVVLLLVNNLWCLMLNISTTRGEMNIMDVMYNVIGCIPVCGKCLK